MQLVYHSSGPLVEIDVKNKVRDILQCELREKVASAVQTVRHSRRDLLHLGCCARVDVFPQVLAQKLKILFTFRVKVSGKDSLEKNLPFPILPVNCGTGN